MDFKIYRSIYFKIAFAVLLIIGLYDGILIISGKSELSQHYSSVIALFDSLLYFSYPLLPVRESWRKICMYVVLIVAILNAAIVRFF